MTIAYLHTNSSYLYHNPTKAILILIYVYIALLPKVKTRKNKGILILQLVKVSKLCVKGQRLSISGLSEINMMIAVIVAGLWLQLHIKVSILREIIKI